MIEWILHLCYCINTFCVINQCTTRQSRDDLNIKANNNKLICYNILTPGDWDTLKELYKLTKLFRDFIARIEDCTITGSYRALWKVFLAIKLMVMEYYKRFAIQYTALVIYNQYDEVKERYSDKKTNFILVCINNTLTKLIKYQKFFSQSLTYDAAIAMNLIFYWQ